MLLPPFLGKQESVREAKRLAHNRTGGRKQSDLSNSPAHLQRPPDADTLRQHEGRRCAQWLPDCRGHLLGGMCGVCCFKQSFWHCNMIFKNSLNYFLSEISSEIVQ